MDVTLVEAEQAHLDLLLPLMNELYLYDRDHLDELNAREALSAYFADDTWARIWLVEIEGLIAGYVVLTFGFSLEYGGRDAIIDELYLREPFRKRGFGSQIIALMIDYCRSMGIKALHLEVYDHNQSAYRFYQRHGFRERDSHFMSRLL